MDKKMYHIAAEVALFGGLCIYVNQKNKSIQQEVIDLQQEIDEISETIESKAHGSFVEHGKLFKLQEQTKTELQQINEMKLQLKQDVTQLQTVREKHNVEQEQIKNSLEEHVNILQQRKHKLDERELSLLKKEEELETKENTILQKENYLNTKHKQLVEFEKRLQEEQSRYKLEEAPPLPQYTNSYYASQATHVSQPVPNTFHTSNSVNVDPYKSDDELVVDLDVDGNNYESELEIDDEIERELNAIEESVQSVQKSKSKSRKSKSKMTKNKKRD